MTRRHPAWHCLGCSISKCPNRHKYRPVCPEKSSGFVPFKKPQKGARQLPGGPWPAICRQAALIPACYTREEKRRRVTALLDAARAALLSRRQPEFLSKLWRQDRRRRKGGE